MNPGLAVVFIIVNALYTLIAMSTITTTVQTIGSADRTLITRRLRFLFIQRLL